ncbi:MAG TPA: alpha-amylase family glycosyl hydrolase, partial [Anaerolineaceae bacterium]|nr:alpha-amylase family glycosyl hydrolase [Anaerolineaceae bacterium]
DQFDGVMNYLLTYACWSFFGGNKMSRELVGHWYTHGPEYFSTEAADFARNVTGLLTFYPRPAVLSQLNLLDSHDTARFLNIVGGNKAMLRLATLFEMTYPGAPCVYYGNEVGVSGGQDPDCRRSFPWDESKWDQDLRSFFQQVIALRKTHPALRSGEFEVLHAANEVVVYLRRLDETGFVVVLNRSAKTCHLDVPSGMLPEGSTWVNRLGSGEACVTGGKLTGLVLPAETGAVLECLKP